MSDLLTKARNGRRTALEAQKRVTRNIFAVPERRSETPTPAQVRSAPEPRREAA